MFEITPSAEFSAWFESLSPELAEEVACALDLLAKAGVALDPSRTSRALLWYDGCSGAELRHPLFPPHTTASMMQSFADVRELLLWHREVVRCLQSAAFRERLARLSPEAASSALLAVENLKVRLKAASAHIALHRHSPASAPGALPKAAFSALSAREALILEQRFDPSSGLKEAFFMVLRLVGLEPAQVMNSPSGLCELTISSTEPPLRVLLGLDAPGKHLVPLLGEPLTRHYYGDSVRLAEQRWMAYCNSFVHPSLDTP